MILNAKTVRCLAGCLVVALALSESGGFGSASISAGRSPADEHLCIRMFKARITYSESERTSTAELIPTYLSPVGVEDAELRAFFLRGQELFNAHLALLESDARYAALLRDAATALIPLVESVNEREGRILVYPYIAARGIFNRLVRQAGPSTVVTVPATMPDPWGSSTRPFASGTQVGTVTRFPRSTLMFHYCAGMRDAGGSGLTITAAEDDPYRRAHAALLGSDAAYRENFERLVGEFVARARTVDPFDVSGTAPLSNEFRTALVESGLAGRIESRAHLGQNTGPEDAQ